MPELNAWSQNLAEICARAFASPQARWSAEEIQKLKNSAHGLVIDSEAGAALFQVVGNEAELLAIFIDPDLQGQGLGFQLLHDSISILKARNTKNCFLDVASDNIAAIRLYQKLGFMPISTRKNYYRDESGRTTDAIVMNRAF